MAQSYTPGAGVARIGPRVAFLKKLRRPKHAACRNVRRVCVKAVNRVNGGDPLPMEKQRRRLRQTSSGSRPRRRRPARVATDPWQSCDPVPAGVAPRRRSQRRLSDSPGHPRQRPFCSAGRIGSSMPLPIGQQARFNHSGPDESLPVLPNRTPPSGRISSLKSYSGWCRPGSLSVLPPPIHRKAPGRAWSM